MIKVKHQQVTKKINSKYLKSIIYTSKNINLEDVNILKGHTPFLLKEMLFY